MRCCMKGDEEPGERTPGLCQFVHIIPDALCNGFPLQLTEHRCDVHHGAFHGAGGIPTVQGCLRQANYDIKAIFCCFDARTVRACQEKP